MVQTNHILNTGCSKSPFFKRGFRGIIKHLFNPPYPPLEKGGEKTWIQISYYLCSITLILHRQPQALQGVAGDLDVGVMNAVDAQALGYFDKQGPVIDVDGPGRLRLRDVQGHAVQVHIRLAEMDKTGRHEKINESSHIELFDAMDG